MIDRPVQNPDLAAAMARVLGHLTGNAPVAPADIAVATGVPRTLVARALAALQAREMVERDPGGASRWRIATEAPARTEEPEAEDDDEGPHTSAGRAMARLQARGIPQWMWAGSRSAALLLDGEARA